MNLVEIRAEIDQIDRELVPIFEKRLAAVRKIARFKARTEFPVRDEAREAEILANVLGACSDDLDNEVRELFEEIMRLSREYQERLMDGKDA